MSDKLDIKTGGSTDVVDVSVTESQWSLRGFLKVILWVVVVLLVVAGVSVLRSFQMENSVERLEDSVDTLDEKTLNLTMETNEAKKAAVEARDVLQAAIDQGRQSAAEPGAVVEALRAIARIEAHLCGGPCDAVGG